MKTSSKAQDKCQVKLSVTLDADEMKAIVKDVEKVFVREAQIPSAVRIFVQDANSSARTATCSCSSINIPRFRLNI